MGCRITCGMAGVFLLLAALVSEVQVQRHLGGSYGDPITREYILETKFEDIIKRDIRRTMKERDDGEIRRADLDLAHLATHLYQRDCEARVTYTEASSHYDHDRIELYVDVSSQQICSRYSTK